MLKNFMFIFLAAGFVACSSANEEDGAESVEVVENSILHFYGDTIEEGDALTPAEFLAKMEGRDSLNAKIEAKINETCRKKGCWMTVDMENGDEMRVRFKDYGFFVPKEGADGKLAVMEGVAYTDTLSVDFLKHLAEDAGKSEEEIAAINEPEIGVNFEAHGVIIRE